MQIWNDKPYVERGKKKERTHTFWSNARKTIPSPNFSSLTPTKTSSAPPQGSPHPTPKSPPIKKSQNTKIKHQKLNTQRRRKNCKENQKIKSLTFLLRHSLLNGWMTCSAFNFKSWTYKSTTSLSNFSIGTGCPAAQQSNRKINRKKT